jgi:photosystem II stability/assembly factor-like uncharacterized protein
MKKFQLLCASIFFCALTLSAQTMEWRQMNSAIMTFGHRPDNPDIIFAGDAAGLIRRSDDRGVTWRAVSFESVFAINDIEFLNSQKGFAVTVQPGLILTTDDGGATWRAIQLLDAAKPDEIARFYPASRIIIVDDQTVFFDIYNHPISASSARETIVTRDGGTTFQIESAPGDIYAVPGGPMMAFGKEADMFGLARFTVYKSNNKGVSWEIVKIAPTGLNNDFNFNGMELAAFVTAEEFFVTANKRLASDKNIYRTTDGGNTFAPLANFPGAKVDHLYFKNSSEGFAITGNSGGKTTFTTSDGGTTWTPSDKNMKAVGQYLGNDMIIAYISDHTALSTDFGKSWTEQADQLNTLQGAASAHFLQVINDKVAVVSLGSLIGGVFSGGNLMKTTDGGITWHAMKDESGQQFKGEVFHFVDENTFFFIGSGYKEGTSNGGYMKIKYTTDGGLTAKDIYTGDYREDVRKIVFIDKDHAVTYSINSPTINFSSDGGQNWTPRNYTGLGTIDNMVFPAVDSWYAINTSRKIFRSTDQGKTWNDITGSINCGSIYFTNATTGYVHGCRKELYKTTDGGTTWMNLSSGLAEQLQYNTYGVMAFQNENVGYMADTYPNGSYGTAKTTDGGATWTWYGGSQVYRILGIDFADENTAAMMDGAGNFARYTGPVTSTPDTMRIASMIVGVQEFPEGKNISVYPNPASDFIIVEATEGQTYSVEITDIMGKTYFRSGAEQSRHKIETKEFPTGMYIVRVNTGNGFLSQRLHIIR